MKHVLTTCAAVACMLLAPCLAHAAVDLDAMKARVTPAPDSVEAARVCAAVTTIYAMNNGSTHGDYADLSTLWNRIAAAKTGITFDNYLLGEVIDDAKSMQVVGMPTIDFYEVWCNDNAAAAAKAANVPQ